VKIKTGIYFFLLVSSTAIAQVNTTNIGSWAMLFNQTRIHNKWSVHSEIQFRSYDIQPNTEQLLIRGGINYHYNPGLIFTAGYGWITNYTNDENVFKDQLVDENRIWEQIVLKNNTGRVYFEHRYRFEQRWITKNENTTYKTRLRYLLRLTIPLTSKEIKKKTVFVGVYNEVFIHLTNASFDRNRLYAAMGYQLNSSTNIQLGYLLQSVGTKSNQYIQLGININPDLRKEK
jgi:Protein of unknown function (DUF2490)